MAGTLPQPEQAGYSSPGFDLASVPIDLPPRAFDSGIVEIVFERNDTAADVTIAGLHIQDDTAYGGRREPPLKCH